MENALKNCPHLSKMDLDPFVKSSRVNFNSSSTFLFHFYVYTVSAMFSLMNFHNTIRFFHLTCTFFVLSAKKYVLPGDERYYKPI